MTAHDTASVPAARVLLAGPDTIHLSLDLEISDELRAKLEAEKTVAQEADKVNAVHCPTVYKVAAPRDLFVPSSESAA